MTIDLLCTVDNGSSQALLHSADMDLRHSSEGSDRKPDAIGDTRSAARAEKSAEVTKVNSVAGFPCLISV